MMTARQPSGHKHLSLAATMVAVIVWLALSGFVGVGAFAESDPE